MRTDDDKLDEMIGMLRYQYLLLGVPAHEVEYIESSYGPRKVDIALGLSRAINGRWGVPR